MLCRPPPHSNKASVTSTLDVADMHNSVSWDEIEIMIARQRTFRRYWGTRDEKDYARIDTIFNDEFGLRAPLLVCWNSRNPHVRQNEFNWCGAQIYPTCEEHTYARYQGRLNTAQTVHLPQVTARHGTIGVHTWHESRNVTLA
jgi:hypothetical protein